MDVKNIEMQRRKNILRENINYKKIGILILLFTYTVIPFIIYLLISTRKNVAVNRFIVMLILSIPVIIWLNRLITFISYRLVVVP
ncbi:hypothetical protein HANVADRAFT_87815 [Hanseniaspora valbyensis NRRL Y-1626]|uniref:Uncharacterized protein n=1 Tax=Hanseniaspora valbyensis NRRL Y-1626 TaxID=766949 RepID=A0A1B7TBU0_9ASCO|nr:hypothetical protein HANVADRAFT_87815 [Hanseniaspora valbyensis NRRL Y-1626]